MISLSVRSLHDPCISLEFDNSDVDGIKLEPLAEEFGLSYSQIKRIVKSGKRKIFPRYGLTIERLFGIIKLPPAASFLPEKGERHGHRPVPWRFSFCTENEP